MSGGTRIVRTPEKAACAGELSSARVRMYTLTSAAFVRFSGGSGRPATATADCSRAEGFFDRRTLRREQLRAVGRDEHIVLGPKAALSAYVYPRLVAEDHARLHRERALPAEHVVLHEVRPFVAVHAHAVADAVREVLVARTVPVVDDHLARGRVDR